MDEWLVRSGYLRRRVLRRHALLCRQGRRPLRVVERDDGEIVGTVSSSRRRPGPLTTGCCCYEGPLPPQPTDRFRGMGPGSRSAWPGRRLDFPEHALEDRVDVLQVIAEIELLLDLRIVQIALHVGVFLE